MTITPVGCSAVRGDVVRYEIDLPGDPRPMTYRMYLPPCFDRGSSLRYPSLYLLHGLAQSDDEWVDLGLQPAMDALISSGASAPFAVIMPGERTGYDMLTAITETLVPALEADWPLGGDPERRAIGGVSRGAGWALRIGAQRPDLFGAIGLHSPAVLSPDLYWLPEWARHFDREAVPRLWLDIGFEDTLLPAAQELRDTLDRIRWPYVWSLSRGEHTSTYWSGRLGEYLEWYAEGWPAHPQDGSGIEE